MRLIYLLLLMVYLLSSSLSAQALEQVLSKTLQTNTDLMQQLDTFKRLEAAYFEVDSQSDSLDVAEISQSIFDELEARGEVNIKEAKLLGAASYYLQNLHSLVYKITKVYIEVLRGQELVSIALEEVKENERLSSEVSFAYELGIITREEKENYTSIWTHSNKRLASERKRYEDIKKEYKEFVGSEPNIEMMYIPPLNVSLLGSKEAISIHAMEYNPALFGYRYNRDNNKVIQKEFKVLESIKERITFEDIGEEANLEDGVSRSIEEFWERYKELENELINLRYYARYYNEKLMQYKESYRLGEKSILAVYTVQNDILNSRRNISQTKYELLLLGCSLLDVMGHLVPSFHEMKNVFAMKQILYIDFKNNSSDLPFDTQVALKNIADYLVKNKTLRVNITGHTSRTRFSKENSNINLSLSRAMRIKLELVNVYAIAKERIFTYAKGHNEPIADNQTMQGRMQNRRIELNFFDE